MLPTRAFWNQDAKAVRNWQRLAILVGLVLGMLGGRASGFVGWPRWLVSAVIAAIVTTLALGLSERCLRARK